MADLWAALIPLIIGSALVPIQIIITILLLRSAAGRITGVAWVAGMTTIRLAQGLVFGLLLSSSKESDAASGGPGTLVSVVLLVVGILFWVTALRQLLAHEDADAPPPKWLAMIETVSPGKAFLLGIGLLAIGAKFWVFTLGAIAAIGDAGLEPAAAIITFLVFVALAESIHLAILAIAYAAPDRSDVLLERMADWLKRHNRLLMIGLGAVFGTWFVYKALGGLGVI
jgi:hypothetical protein